MLDRYVNVIAEYIIDRYEIRLLKRILAGGKKLVSWNQKPDGSPIDFADPGQLYFGPRYYGPKNWDDARRYADMYGIKLDLADGQGKEDSPLLTAKYRWE